MTHHRNTLCRPYAGPTMAATSFLGCKAEALHHKEQHAGFIWNPSGSLAAAYEDGAKGVCKFVLKGATCVPGERNGAGHWDSLMLPADTLYDITATTAEPATTAAPCTESLAAQQAESLAALEKTAQAVAASMQDMLQAMGAVGVETAALEREAAALDEAIKAQGC